MAGRVQYEAAQSTWRRGEAQAEREAQATATEGEACHGRCCTTTLTRAFITTHTKSPSSNNLPPNNRPTTIADLSLALLASRGWRRIADLLNAHLECG